MIKNCGTCKRDFKGQGLKECSSCASKRRRQTKPLSFLKQLYSHIINRCNDTTTELNRRYYLGKSYCTREEFLHKFASDQQFLICYQEWKNSGYIYKLTPSINRIDKNKDYALDNIEIITHSENAGIDKIKLPVLMFDLEGNFIREFESKWQAHKELGIPNGNICKVAYGKRRSAGGFIFKFKK